MATTPKTFAGNPQAGEHFSFFAATSHRTSPMPVPPFTSYRRLIAIASAVVVLLAVSASVVSAAPQDATPERCRVRPEAQATVPTWTWYCDGTTTPTYTEVQTWVEPRVGDIYAEVYLGQDVTAQSIATSMHVHSTDTTPAKTLWLMGGNQFGHAYEWEAAGPSTFVAKLI
jgi:hypothetical protein